MAQAGWIDSIDEIHSFAVTGDVMHSETWSRQQISASSSGGGGNIGPYGGRIDAPRVSITSRSSDVQRFFIKRETDGREFEVELTDSEFTVRPGHRITALWVGDATSKRCHVMGAYNHQTRIRSAFTNRLAWIIPTPPSSCAFICLGLGIAAGLMLYIFVRAVEGAYDEVSAAVPVSLLLFAFAVAVAPIVIASRRSSRHWRLSQDAGKRVNELLDSAIAEATAAP